MENGWMEKGLSGCGKWMWKVDVESGKWMWMVESGKWRGSGSHRSTLGYQRKQTYAYAHLSYSRPNRYKH